MPTTVNFSWAYPTPGGDKDTWGAILNAAWDAADATVFSVSNVANAALPKAGGTLTGQLSLPGGGSGGQAVTVAEAAALVTAGIGGHIGNTSNPHSVTAAQVGAYTIAAADAAFAKLGGGTFTGSMTFSATATLSGPVVLGTQIVVFSGSISLDMSGASRKYLTVTGNCTVTLTNKILNQTVEMFITQSGSTGDITWVGVNKWIGGVPILSNVAGRIDLVALTVLTDNSVIGQHIGYAA